MEYERIRFRDRKSRIKKRTLMGTHIVLLGDVESIKTEDTTNRKDKRNRNCEKPLKTWKKVIFILDTKIETVYNK